MIFQRPSCDCFTAPCDCGDGTGYDSAGNYYNKGLPIDDRCLYSKDPNCVNQGQILNLDDWIRPHVTRPLTNTVYVPTPTQTTTTVLPSPVPVAVSDSGDTVNGVMGFIENHPIVALGGAALALFLIMGGMGGGGTYEQITTKRKGFGQ